MSEPSREQRLRVGITGAGGLVGSALRRSLLEDGHRVVRLVRHEARPLAESTGETECQWSPAEGVVDLDRLEGISALVHLAGENLAEGRWTDRKRQRIRDSRVQGTRNLVESLGRLDHPPEVLVSASAIGYYGDRGDEELREDSEPGQGFLAGVCVDWESEALAAREHGLRVVITRFGVILSRDGGALAKMLTPFKMGMGGKLGSGEQYFSWVTLDDVVRALRFCIAEPGLEGPVNVTAPEPVTNAELTRELGSALSRPTFMTVPRAALRMALGDMADEALLASARALPAKLREMGFEFRHKEVGDALDDLV